MDFSYISETFIKALAGIPVTLGIMIVSILISFFPALFLALGRIHKSKRCYGIFSGLSCFYSLNTADFVNFIFLQSVSKFD